MLFRKTTGDVPEQLIINVPQPVLCEPWKCDGRCMSLHTGGKYFYSYKGRVLNSQTLFNMMG